MACFLLNITPFKFGNTNSLWHFVGQLRIVQSHPSSPFVQLFSAKWFYDSTCGLFAPVYLSTIHVCCWCTMMHFRDFLYRHICYIPLFTFLSKIFEIIILICLRNSFSNKLLILVVSNDFISTYIDKLKNTHWGSDRTLIGL